MGPNRIKYLELLQAVIARMAEHQFKLRTWSVGLGTAVIGYAASKDGNSQAALIAILPAMSFWILDAYYLALERKFRERFRLEAEVDDDLPSFSFAVERKGADWRAAGQRPAVFLVHGPVLVVAGIVAVCG